MKKILVTGKNSYIGNSFCDVIKEFSKYTAEKISVRGDEWKAMDFSQYDVIFHVAGIAHWNLQKLSEEQKKLYYKVNTELTIALAKKAKAEGVKQFIFLSSASVYGDGAQIGKDKMINTDTPVAPANLYGDSKVKAEKGLTKLMDSKFYVAILRPPMIYGKGAKGNYGVLQKFAKKLPIFPKVQNKRSMCYIGNLVELVRLIIDNGDSGIFWPCNKEDSNTSELVKMIAAVHGKKIFLIPGFQWMLKLLGYKSNRVRKAFGNLVYQQAISEYPQEYRIYTLRRSIEVTEKDE